MNRKVAKLWIKKVSNRFQEIPDKASHSSPISALPSGSEILAVRTQKSRFQPNRSWAAAFQAQILQFDYAKLNHRSCETLTPEERLQNPQIGIAFRLSQWSRKADCRAAGLAGLRQNSGLLRRLFSGLPDVLGRRLWWLYWFGNQILVWHNLYAIDDHSIHRWASYCSRLSGPT